MVVISALSWNVNGLVSKKRILNGNKPKYEHLHYILEHFKFPKIVFLQETHLYRAEMLREWENTFKEYKCYFNFGEFNSRGTAIFIHKSIPFTCQGVIQDRKGRCSIVKGIMYGERVSLVSVYAPHGDGRKARIRKQLFESILEHDLTGILYIAGDFNSVVNKDLDRFNADKADINHELIDFVNENRFLDAFRVANGNQIDFSYIVNNGRTRSRIDTMFINRIAKEKILEMTYEHGFGLSDHKPFIVKLNFEKILVGHDFWKNKPHIYKEEHFSYEFSKMWEKHLYNFREQIIEKLENRTFRGDVREVINLLEDGFDVSNEIFLKNINLDCKWWEGFKEDVRICIKKTQRRVDYNGDNKMLDMLRSDYLRTNDLEKRERFANRMDELLTKINRKANYKIAVDHRLYRERINAPFFRQVRQVHDLNFIRKLQDENDNILTKREDIQNNLSNRYSDLYRRRDSDETDLQFFLNNLPQVQQENTGAFTLEECRKVIFKTEDNKCPGLDGIRIEFYKNFFHIIGPFYVQFINNCVEGGVYPKSWTESALQLIPKTKDEILSFETMRPLSMLNVDYKIFAGVNCERLVEPTPDIINSNQTGGVPNKLIQNHTLLIHLLLLYFTKIDDREGDHGRNGFIISLDNRKAFDLIIRSFLWKVLKAFGYSERLVGILQKLYTGCTARILINGFLGEKIEVNGGVRQGCPLSATLYTIFIEPLARAILNARAIRGFTLPSRQEVKMTQHSDDMCLLMGSEHAAITAMSLVNRYSPLSGAEINYRKSFVIHATAQNFRQGRLAGIPILPKNQTRKILGIYYGSDTNVYIKKNWETLSEKIEESLEPWKSAELSLVGKAMVANTIALSKAVYLLQAIGYNKMWATRIYKDISTGFFFPKKVDIEISYLMMPKNTGGLSVCDLEQKAMSLHIKRFKQFLFRPDDDNVIRDPSNSILSFFLDKFIMRRNSGIRDVRIMPIHPSTTMNLNTLTNRVEFCYFFYSSLKEIERLQSRYRPPILTFDLNSKQAYTFINEHLALENRRGTERHYFKDENVDRETEIKIWDKKIFCKKLDPKVQAHNYKLITKTHPLKTKVFYGQTEKNNPVFADDNCSICETHNLIRQETVEHTFKDCVVASNIWHRINQAMRNASVPEININHSDFFGNICMRKNVDYVQNFIISETLFILWKNRNAEHHNQNGENWLEVYAKIRTKLDLISNIDRQFLKKKIYNVYWKKLNRVIHHM